MLVSIKNYQKVFLAYDELNASRMKPFALGSELNCTIKEWGWWTSTCDLRGVLTSLNTARDDYSGMIWHGQRISAVQMLIRNKAYIPPLKSVVYFY